MSTATIQATDPTHFLWVEKFRPDNIEDTILPQDFKASLMKGIQESKLPSFIFYSPSPGTGKTTTALAVAKSVGSVLFLNASIDNSIDTIRTRITQFATTSSLNFDKPFKVVVLDEADRLSPAAQDGLKALIEDVSKNCSFILTCNNKAKLIDPLRSRCSEVDFIYSKAQQLEVSTLMLKRLIDILEAEGVPYDVKALGALTKAVAPDNRKLLHISQEYFNRHGKIDEGILALQKSRDVKTYIDCIRKKNFDPMVQWCVDNSDSIGEDIYRYIYDALKDDLTDQSRASLILTLNDYQRVHNTVPDRFVHFTAMSTQVMIDTVFK
ncbi:clamp loader subunit [Acinetobacter phage SH-Ab 15599]|nr:clamp loader subunit [Acinetobacter phage SH-Ab 15599]